MLLISGLSGAGKSTVLHALEDAGFFCTDNLPIEMRRDWSRLMRTRGRPAAACLDARSCDRDGDLVEAVQAIMLSGEGWRLLFLEASDAALMQRYSTLRRRHPFAPDLALDEAITAERHAMTPIREMADLVLDSSDLNPYELAARAEAFWRADGASHPVRCTLLSFSFRNGLPRQADMVVDARFLPNPHYAPELARLTGRDEAVARWLAECGEAVEAEQRLRDWLEFAWPLMVRERKAYFTLAIGCSGGRHRSVWLVERLAAWMRGRPDMAAPVVRHRELGLVLPGDAA
ncbi:MAG: RNase adapter RapZ [Mariprofundaceae bacterium]